MRREFPSSVGAGSGLAANVSLAWALRPLLRIITTTVRSDTEPSGTLGLPPTPTASLPSKLPWSVFYLFVIYHFMLHRTLTEEKEAPPPNVMRLGYSGGTTMVPSAQQRGSHEITGPANTATERVIISQCELQNEVIRPVPVPWVWEKATLASYFCSRMP